MKDKYDLERRVLKLELLDLLQDKVSSKLLWNYNKDLDELLTLPEQEKKAGLKALANEIIKTCGKVGK